MRRRLAIAAALTAAALLAAPATAAAQERFRVLVFSKTAGFRHASIPVGISTIEQLGDENSFGVDATEDSAAFTKENLRRYAAIVFLSTTGNVLEPPQRTVIEDYMNAGGGFVGIHSAADTEYDWRFYEQLVGAYFKSHPVQQTAEIVREDPIHPATAHVPGRFRIFDEFYSFRRNPRPDVHVLLSIDESTYEPDPNTSHLPGGPAESGRMGDHPMSWCHDIGRGRAFYTALGHEAHLYSEPWYRRHLLGGVLTAAGAVDAGCAPRRQAGAPGRRALRLVRRCARGGRLVVRLAGEVAGVRSVAFKLGGRRVARDRSAPFRRIVGRRALRNRPAGANRLVAVVRDEAGRVVLRRGLPACAARRSR